MKKFIKIFVVVLLSAIVAIVGTYYYLQNHKKGLVKHFIQQAISDKTNNLYYLKYDSSMIDEVNGNVYFSDIYLQSDSEQAALLKRTDSLPNVLINIYIKSVTASGIDMQAYIEKKVVYAKSILIDAPTIQIINTGEHQLQREDTLAIYQKIVGEFEAIKADNIEIKNCTFISKNRKGEVQTRLSNAQMVLTQFKVDSTRDYSNILSYFINNIEAKVDSIYIKGKNKLSKFYLTKVHYNSSSRSLEIDKMISYTSDEKAPTSTLNNVRCSNLDVYAFIQQHRLQAGKVSCAGGKVTMYLKKKNQSAKNVGNTTFTFPEEFFDEVEIGSLELGNTTLIVRDLQHPTNEAITVNGVRFSVTNEINVKEGNTFTNIIEKARWKLSADGLSWITKDKMYTMTLKGIVIDRQNSTGFVRQFSMLPTISENEFVSRSTKQGDFYHINISNIKLGGLDISKAINESVIEIQQASLNLNLQVYNDRNLPINNDSKVGKYPQQLLQKTKVPLYIKKVMIQNSSISYRERALSTHQVGNVQFTNINGSIENITNLPEHIKKQPVLMVYATATFLNAGKTSTTWKLPLNANNGAFSISGQMEKMDAAAFNLLSMPLGMTKISGQINRLNFDMNGTDQQATGNLTLLYNDLKVESFKMEANEVAMKSKKLENIFSNALIKNDNPAKGATRQADFYYKRELNKSFFNLIWKSIFDGVQKTIMSKNALNMQKELGNLKKKKRK